MGFFWGVDQDSIVGLFLLKNFFLTKFEPKITGKIFTLCFGFWPTIAIDRAW